MNIFYIGLGYCQMGCPKNVDEAIGYCLTMLNGCHDPDKYTIAVCWLNQMMESGPIVENALSESERKLFLSYGFTIYNMYLKEMVLDAIFRELLGLDYLS
jgi:hypothetical protein